MKSAEHAPPIQLILAGIVIARLMFPPFPSVSFTASFVCPVACALLVWSISHVYGPTPFEPPCCITTLTVLPFVTEVMVLAANCVSVFSPMSMFPLSSVRPHSLTIFLLISSALMMFASLVLSWTWRGRLAGEPLVPWAERRTPWAWMMDRRVGVMRRSCLREGILYLLGEGNQVLDKQTNREIDRLYYAQYGKMKDRK